MTTVGTGNEATRVAWIERVIREIPAGARLLDAGAGELPFKRLCGHLNYVSQDFGEYDGKGDSVGLQTATWDNSKLDIVSDISSIPEPDASFDAIMCIEVFEHLPNPLLALTEFSRLLKSGGLLVLTAPFCSLSHFTPYHFATGFSRYWYEQHLPANGFEIQELMSNGNYFEYVAQEMRRLPEIANRYGGQRRTVIERMAGRIVLRMLQRFSNNGAASGELLNFGYHVRARKR